MAMSYPLKKKEKIIFKKIEEQKQKKELKGKMSFAKASKTILNERKKPQYLNIDNENSLEILPQFTHVENIFNLKDATKLNQLLKKNKLKKSCGSLVTHLKYYKYLKY